MLQISSGVSASFIEEVSNASSGVKDVLTASSLSENKSGSACPLDSTEIGNIQYTMVDASNVQLTGTDAALVYVQQDSSLWKVKLQ